MAGVTRSESRDQTAAVWRPVQITESIIREQLCLSVPEKLLATARCLSGHRLKSAVWRVLIFPDAPQLLLLLLIMRRLRESWGRSRAPSEGRQTQGASAATFNLQVRGCYAPL